MFSTFNQDILVLTHNLECFPKTSISSNDALNLQTSQKMINYEER